MMICAAITAFAQADKADVRKGNRQFRKGQFPEAEISYRKGVLADTMSVTARYNLANTLYREDNYDEAAKQLDSKKEIAAMSPQGADYFFNMGDVALKRQDYQTAVAAFAQSILMNPEDVKAKENFIYARQMLQNQPQGGQGQDQNQDQNQKQDRQQQQQNQQDQNQQQQPQDNQDNQDRQDQDRDGISPQQAQQMLQAVQAKEKETQDKVNKEKAAVLKSRQRDKNW